MSLSNKDQDKKHSGSRDTNTSDKRDDSVKSSASAVFRSLWKGLDRLAGSQGNLRVEVYTQMIQTLDWRSLGSLLVQLCEPLNNIQTDTPVKPQRIVRCTVALAATLFHMQSVSFEKSPPTPVNDRFVTSLFATLIQATLWIHRNRFADYMVVSRYVFKAVSGVLGDSGDKDRNARFDNSAVLDGILGADTKLTDTAESGKVCGPPATKKRRVSVTGKGNTHIAHADILVMLASCMEDTTESRSDRYAIKVLRICNGTIVDRILGSGKPLVTHPPSLVTHVFDLANALVNRGSAVLGLQKQNGSSSQKSVANVVDSAEYIGGLFACIRDIVPLVRVDLARQRMDGLSDEITSQLLESVSRLCLDLAGLFRPLVLSDTSTTSIAAAAAASGGDNTAVSIYRYCAEKRHRCYQWAALCRLTTWIACWGNLMATTQQTKQLCTEAMAEGSRVCWVQCSLAHSQCLSSDPAIWLLVLSESLYNLSLEYPNFGEKFASIKPPFTLSNETQTKVFSLLAPLISIMGRRFMVFTTTSALRTLLISCTLACEKLLRLVNPRAASLGLFQPLSLSLPFNITEKSEGVFSWHKCSPAEYIFRPIPQNTKNIVGDDNGTRLGVSEPIAGIPQLDHTITDSIAEQRREASEEIVHETNIAGIFVAINCLVKAAVEIDANSGLFSAASRKALALMFCTTVRWLCTFATSARDNVDRQTRIHEGQQRVNIRLVGDKVRLNKSATDWSRLQTIPNLRVDIGSTDNGDSVNISMINNIGVDCSSTTYSRTVACTLRLFIALSVFGILGHDSKATLEYGLVWDSESGGTDTGAQKFFDQCKVLKQLLSEQDFRIMAFSSLKIMSAVVGVRSSLYTSDASKLRLPNVYHRDHSPRSNEALMHLAMNIGLGRLLLEPVFITHCVECIRNGQLVESSKMLCAAQIWLDMIGNIVRHSLFRSYLRISASNKVKSGQANEAGPALPFLLWWQLALAASVRCLIDMLPVDTNSDKSTAGHTRLLYLLPSHLMSWYMYLPSSDREIKQFTNLHPSALTTLTVNLDGTTAATCASKSDTDRLYQWLLSFPQPEKSSSMIYIVYFLAAKLWLCAPELQISDVTETALRASRDVWGLASDSLQLLARLLQRSAMHRDFLDLGLVDDFASVLQILVTRKQLPRLVESLVLRPLDERHSDLITIPLADTDDFGELENTHELSYLGGEDDLVGKLLHDSLQLQKSTIKTRLDVDYHSESAMAQLWDTYIGGLLRLPVTIVFRAATSNIFNGGATATALHPSDSSKNSNSRKLPTQNIQVDILDCMRDRDDVLFKVFMPLLGAKHSLSEPSVMWEDIGVAFPVDLIVLALRAADKSIIARVCTSAAFVFPIMSTSKNCTSNAGNIAAELALVLVNQLIRGGDEYDRCGTALLFFSWKQLATLVARTSECASELMTEIVQMAKDLGKFLSVEMSTSDVHTLQTSCGTPPAIIGSNEQVCGNDGASSLLYLNGRDRSDPQPPIVASKALLAYQSPVFATMFGSDFAEGHALQNNQAPCITLKCAHQTLQALVDIHNRFALLLYPTPDAQWDGEVPALVSAFLMEVDQKYSPDELAAVLEHAIFYMQTPVVLLLLHLFITKIGSKCVFTDNVLSVLGLALSEACCGSCFMDSESVALAVRRSLSAMMLLYSDRFELQGTIGEFSDRFIEDVSFLFQS